MASKKCPKCGEDNPAEAVMCWACYTPLSGAAAGAGATGLAGAAGFAGNASLGQAPVGVPNVEEAPKKAVDPKLIGVVAFLLIGGVVAFLVNGGMSSSTDAAVTASTDAAVDPAVAPASTGGVAPPALSVAPSANSGPAPAPKPVIFSVLTAPNPKFATGTIGVLVPSTASAQAASSAKFVRDQFARNGRWTRMQVVVFADTATGDAFRSYQGPRGGQPLTSADYQQLSAQGVWTNTPAFLESSGKTEVVHYPSKNPNGWWGR